MALGRIHTVLHNLMSILNISKEIKQIVKSGGRIIILMHGESRGDKKRLSDSISLFYMTKMDQRLSSSSF